MSKNIVITTGGTGGHVIPAEALGAILSLGNNKITYVTDPRGKKFFTSIPTVLNVSSFTGNLMHKIKNTFNIAISIFKAIYILKNVDLVIGFGGYASFPILIAAVIKKIPIVLHEQNAIVGRVNNIFYKYCIQLFTAFQNTQGILYPDKVCYVGMPIREKIFHLKRNRTRITNDIVILITGGSQGSKLFDQIPQMLSKLQKKHNLIVYHQVRQESLEIVTKQYNKINVKEFVVQPFFDNIGQIIADADLVITRAGASILAEITHLKIPSIIIPIQNSINNHQYLNAMEYGNNPANIVIEEANIAYLSQILKQLFDENQLEELQRHASKNPSNRALQEFIIKIQKLFLTDDFNINN
jgi:UDP-N-acetylglucosamine--N-acetylmuramyl-(pentapeptide) pyrophosphoryl-undecaprenol N-acetylglucosamine transferase